MARKLASIVKICKVSPIENADRLEVAEMEGKGWKVVIQKGEFNVGDEAVYFEIDSFLNPDDERYAFLRERCLRRFVSKSGNVLREGIRIKSIKLRGVISQGLLLPLDNFQEVKERIHYFTDEDVWETKDEQFVGKYVLITRTKKEYKEYIEEDAKKYSVEHNGSRPDYDWKKYIYGDNCTPLIGADVTNLLRVEHYDEVKEQLQPAMGNPISADALGKFPSDFIPKTDEERIQNLGEWFQTMKGRKWQVSCKHDGTSCTIAFSPTIDFDNPNIVCSRNLRLKRETTDGKVPIYWQMAEKYGILNKLSELLLAGEEYAVQGEIVGPGINKCRNKETDYKFYCFRIYDIKNQKWVNPKKTVELCKEFNIPHVQIVKDDFAFFDEITTMDEALKFAEGKTEEGNEREGVVLKTVDDLPYASFKIVSNRYLMKQED